MSRPPFRTRPGCPFPLGATWDGAGVNFALWSENATAVDLCLFEPEPGGRERGRLRIRERTDQVWHVYLEGAGPGLFYGYRAQGRYAPAEGHRFNPAKLLLDPYARAVEGDLRWHDALCGYRPDDPDGDVPDARDSAPYTLRSVVVDPAFAWQGDRPPRTPWHRTVIYELHVKGFTARHPDVPPARRGTFAGLASPAAIEHLTRLGVTTVELMPVHASVSERALAARGLTNYWGYNSIGYFAPDARLAATGPPGAEVAEFKTMVRELHRAGLEVICDVVYNHTAEGTHRGPTLSLRGIDNAAYYRLRPENRREYLDYTGCGNTLDARHPAALQLVMDSLRYWIEEMHVDGFRFDLAPALARGAHAVDRLSAFFTTIRQDPVVSRVKLIAEPWDLGEGGYQVGNFPAGWAEWNGRYRDTIRRVWRGDDGQAAELGYRLTGSSDLYEGSGRGPQASVNFVTAHDGFTLTDLVSYEVKRNETNGEDNRDGSDHNLSWNGGVEGPTDDPEVQALRDQQARNFLATLLLSQGTPMLTAGDEVGRTQRGNNNAYCQDSEISWFPWPLSPAAAGRLEYVRRLIALRLAHPVFHRRSFFRGQNVGGAQLKDLAWLAPGGTELTAEEWHDPDTRCLGLRLAGDAIPDVDEAGEPISGDSFLVLLNAGPAPVPFRLPGGRRGMAWHLVLDTRDWAVGEAPAFEPGGAYPLDARCMAVLRLAPAPTGGVSSAGGTS